ncbi:hypothetical protein ACFLVP_02080 [Chloroflexota bacterium]
MIYYFNKADFKKAFQFAVNYHLDPTKSPSGRTSGEPRGLGAILDNFVRGKLIEIGVQNMLINANNTKDFKLNFDIVTTSKAKDEPDITAVVNNEIEREPKAFIEIKSTSSNDRWIGLTAEQLATIRANSGQRPIYFVYVSLNSGASNTANWKAADFVGMYLKTITNNPIFKQFNDLNAGAELDSIISAEELDKYGTAFNEGNYLYETSLFSEVGEKSIKNNEGNLRARITRRGVVELNNQIFEISDDDGKVNPTVSKFTVSGRFEILDKNNPKSYRCYINCLSDTTASSDVFGTFKLEKNKYYQFHLETLGGDPKLKRNNLWISKNRVRELLKSGAIEDPSKRIKRIADLI